jgi:hypothetical protein
MRRFETPSGPPGWVGMGADLLRIVDPTGRAIAWLAPGFGASCVGFAVRSEEAGAVVWRQLFRVGGPRDLRVSPLDYGCAVLGPEVHVEGSAHEVGWRFVERDPTAATCTAQVGTIRLELMARLEDAALWLELLATNEGTDAVTIAPGLRLCFAHAIGNDISRWIVGPSVELAGDGAVPAVSIASAVGEDYHWRSIVMPGGGVAVEVRARGSTGTGCAPDEKVRLGLVVAGQ